MTEKTLDSTYTAIVKDVCTDAPRVETYLTEQKTRVEADDSFTDFGATPEKAVERLRYKLSERIKNMSRDVAFCKLAVMAIDDEVAG